MPGRWQWIALGLVAQGVALAGNPNYVDASGAMIPSGMVFEDKKTGAIYVEDPTNGQRVYTKNSPHNIRHSGKDVSNYTTSPIPLLVDWNTSHPAISIYEGKLKGPHGEEERELIRLCSPDSSGGRSSYYNAETGAHGEFKFAFPSTKSFGKYHQPVLWPFGTNTDRDSRRLSSNSFNDLQWSIMNNVAIRLLSPEGKIRGNLEIARWHLRADPINFWGRIIPLNNSDDPSSKYGEFLRLDWKGGIVGRNTGKMLLAQGINVPGRYYVKSFGRLFGEQIISETDTIVTFTEVTHPFTVRGKVVDSNDNPVANASVELRNPEGLGIMGSPEHFRSGFESVHPDGYFKSGPQASNWNTLPGLNVNELNETLAAYSLSTTTNESGEWEISGLTMPGDAEVYVSADGYEAIEIHELYNPDRPKLPDWDKLLAGDYQTTPVKLLKQGEVRGKAKPAWIKDGRKTGAGGKF